jgi:hypothetical protein
MHVGDFAENGCKVKEIEDPHEREQTFCKFYQFNFDSEGESQPSRIKKQTELTELFCFEYFDLHIRWANAELLQFINIINNI